MTTRTLAVRSTQDSSPLPALPDSYGLPPDGFRLPEATRLGPVVLQVSSLGRSLDYYRSVLGLEVLDQDSTRARLGSLSGTPLVELRERSGARPRPRGRTGLFHFAILLPERAALGRFARHLERLGIDAGASDHRVSEALYLQDPDNLGIEVYADRPRSAWRRLGRELVMTTEPIDRPSLLAAAGDAPWRGMPAGTTMGHVHLHVGDLDRTSEFYSGVLGFDRMVWSYPGALFLGAGGYHHHLGTNVWAGRSAAPPAADEAQLVEWTLDLPDGASLDAATESLRTAGHVVDRIASDGDPAVVARDPWRTAVRLRAREVDAITS